MVQELGQVDVNNGTQHQNVLVFLWVFELKEEKTINSTISARDKCTGSLKIYKFQGYSLIQKIFKDILISLIKIQAIFNWKFQFLF